MEEPHQTKEKQDIKNSPEQLKDTQFYLITLEDSNGEHQQIKVFKNSDAAEIAFNFCKENNLDYKSMKYIKKNIQKIIEKFDEPNHKLFFLDNSYSSIQEVDEENLVSENTLLDNKANEEKNGNKNRIKEIKFENYKINNEKNLNKDNDDNNKNDLNIRNDKLQKNNNLILDVNNKKNQKRRNHIKLDFDLIKAKMKAIKLKNSILKVKKEKNKENLTEEKIVFKTEKNKKVKNKIIDINQKKQQNLLNNKINNNKIKESINENIIEKYIKNINKNANSKIKHNYPKKEDQFKGNKTFIEVNKTKIKKEKSNFLQKIKRNKNLILSNITDDNKKIKEKINHAKINSSRLTPKKSSYYLDTKENSKSKNIFKPKKNKILELRNILQTNKEIFSNLVSNLFTQRYNNTNINKIMQNCYEQIQDKNPLKNKIIKNKMNRRKYSYVSRDGISKYSFDLIKSNDIKPNNFEKQKKKSGFEPRNKNISEVNKGLDNLHNNTKEYKNSKNILKTNYMINKRCRIINNKNKKNMSLNLSKYFSNNKKPTKSKKDSLEINSISNLNFNNTYDNDREKEYNVHKNKRALTNRNSGIFSNNKNKLLKILNPKGNNSKILKSHNQLTINNCNTNVKNYRVLNTINSYKAWKKLIKIKSNSKNNKSKKKLRKNSNNLNSMTSSYSLLTDENDGNLKVMDQYYTINNTINITNNNSLMDNFVNNLPKNKKKFNQEDKAIIIIKKIFMHLDKDNVGIIIFNLNQKIKYIFSQNNLLFNNEKKIILEKMFKFLFENYKKDNNYDLYDDQIIINEKNFMKYMNNIFKNKLNANEKNIFLSIANENNNIKQNRITLNEIEQKKFFRKFKNI